MAVISPPSSPPPSPACRPSPLARHHITAETTALSPTPLQRPRHRPNRGRYSHRHLNCHHPNHRRHPSRRHHPNYGRLTAATPVTAAQPSLPQPPPDPVAAAAPTAPLPPVSPGPHLQHHPSYTSTSSMYLFKCQIFHYFLCMNVTNLV